MRIRSRTESIRFKLMPDGNIRAWQSGTDDKRGVSEWMITNVKNVSPTVTTAQQTKIYLVYEAG